MEIMSKNQCFAGFLHKNIGKTNGFAVVLVKAFEHSMLVCRFHHETFNSFAGLLYFQIAKALGHQGGFGLEFG